MRVTSQMIYQSATDSAQQSRQRVQQAVEEISSGRRIQHPGEDPGAAAMMVRYRMSIDRFDNIKSTLGRTVDELNAADGALQQTSSLITRARELAMQFGSDHYDATQRAAGANEVDAVLRGMTQALNTQVGNRYVFGGNKDATSPFDAAGNYSGDGAVRQIEVAPGVVENASVRADVAFKGANGGVDVFQVLTDLSAALRANNGAGIRSSLDGFDKSMGQIGQALADTGGMTNVIDVARSANLELRDRDTNTLADVADVDVIEAASRLQLASQALDASLSATARSFQLSLLDKLG